MPSLSAAVLSLFCVRIIRGFDGQAVLLLALGGSILSVWGAPGGSDMRTDALAFLQVKALGAPFTVLLLVLQVRLSYVSL